MLESELMRKIQVQLSALGARVFRNNRGIGWVGRVQRFTDRTNVIVNPEDIVIRNARPLHAGLIDGASDLIGWDSNTGLFVACETKSLNKKPTIEQTNFLLAARSSGAVAFYADSVEMAIEKYREQINGPRKN